MFLNGCGDRGTETVFQTDIDEMDNSVEEGLKSGKDWNQREANDTVEESDNFLSEKELTKNKREELHADSKISHIQSKSIELSLLFSIPASLGLILASEDIVNALFGYGSFTLKDINLTSSALKYFGYGVPAFALIKVLSNFFFARDNTKTPFYISSFIVFLNVVISITFFNQIGFLIIPIATSISTWIGVLIFLYLLKKKNYLIYKILKFN